MIDDVLLSGGANEKMLRDFSVVAHCTAASGEDKFEPRSLRRLADFLVGRRGHVGYGRRRALNRDAPLYELCQLINAIDAAGGTTDARWHFFLGQDLVRRSTCRSWFREILAAGGWRRGGFEMTEKGLSIHYADNKFFLTFGRMPFLVALFEFLATMEDMAFHGELNGLLDAMIESPAGRRAIQDATNRIAAALRRYRSQHLDRGGNDEAFTAIHRFLRSNHTGPGGDHWKIGDATVLAFWQQHNTGTFRTYRNAFERFTTFLGAVANTADLRAAAAAVPLGSDREMGEVDPDDLSGASAPLGDGAAWQDPLHLLDQEPASEIKFLTKTGEREALAPLMAFGPFAVQLPLAFLRYLSYGKVQAAITTILQFRPDQPPLDDHVKCVDAESYPDLQDRHCRLLEHLVRMQRATYYALRRASPGSAVGNVVALDATSDCNLFDMVRRDLDDEPDIPDAEVAVLEKEAAEVFRRISRRGFDEDGLVDEDRLEGFRIGASVLYAAAHILRRFLDTLRKLDGDGNGLLICFQDDRTTFTGEFVKLYGVTND